MIIFLTAFWRAGLYFALYMGFFLTFVWGWQNGFMAGAVAGFCYGLIMASIAYYNSRTFTQNRPLMSNEKLLEEGTAYNHEKDGWLYLTDSRLFYISDKLNITSDELSFPLSEIVSAEIGFRMGIIPNKLILDLKNGAREEFVVENPKNWVNRVKRASNLQIEAPRDLKYL